MNQARGKLAGIAEPPYPPAVVVALVAGPVDPDFLVVRTPSPANHGE